MTDRRRRAGVNTPKEKKRHLPATVFAAPILVVVIVTAYFAYSYLTQSPVTTDLYSQFRAAIVDQLSLTFPNQTFVDATTNMLKQAGYTVDYHAGENVTVDFYRNLPNKGYRIIVLRVHSAVGTQGEAPVCLFTSEPYSQSKYVSEQLVDRVVKVRYNIGSPDEEQYFGIFPGFVESSMSGTFRNTTILMMGCNGLAYNDMASAFIKKGAKVYVGWSDTVSAEHTDLAFTYLLQHWLAENMTLQQSVQETFKDVGFDPTFKSLLMYYPLDAGNQTLERPSP
jgi:hypothetical protein